MISPAPSRSEYGARSLADNAVDLLARTRGRRGCNLRSEVLAVRFCLSCVRQYQIRALIFTTNGGVQVNGIARPGVYKMTFDAAGRLIIAGNFNQVSGVGVSHAVPAWWSPVINSKPKTVMVNLLAGPTPAAATDHWSGGASRRETILPSTFRI